MLYPNSLTAQLKLVTINGYIGMSSNGLARLRVLFLDALRLHKAGGISDTNAQAGVNLLE